MSPKEEKDETKLAEFHNKETDAWQSLPILLNCG